MTTFCDIQTHLTEPSRDTESLLEEACCRAVEFLQNTWQLTVPNCHVYVTTKWQTIYLEHSPFFWRTMYRLGLSVLKHRRERLETLWQRSAGWFQRYGKLHFIAIKPLTYFQTVRLEHSPLYNPMNASQKFCNTLVHELTHAFTAHLNLPLWLNEGVALFAAEQALDYGGLKEGTLELLHRPRKTIGYFKLPSLAGEDFFYHYAKGYWLTRYLEEQGGLEPLLKKRHTYSTINKHVQKVVSNQPIDEVLHNHFKTNQELNSSPTQQGVVTPGTKVR
jgi:hypothetical protein